MNLTPSNLLRAALLACACVSFLPLAATGHSPDAPAGGPYCLQSRDGHAVQCGGAAQFCEESSDGRRVACGGAAPFCARSWSGEDVACGGQAPFCDKSSDGKRVACGGLAGFCERSGDGHAVACGGQAPEGMRSLDANADADAGRGGVPGYERIGRFIYGFQRAGVWVDELRGQDIATHAPAALAERARKLADHFDFILKKHADVPDAEIEATLREAAAVSAALDQWRKGGAKDLGKPG